MIKRFVKLTFKPECIQDFITLFNSNKDLIGAAEGCTSLELLQDVNNKCVFFTFSIWQNTEYIEQYRNSDLFKRVWAHTKILFADKPEAWSLEVF